MRQESAYRQERLALHRHCRRFTGETVMGANVVQKGHKKVSSPISTVVLSLRVTGRNPIVTVSYVGCATAEVQAQKGKQLNIVMQDKTTELGELSSLLSVSRANRRLSDMPSQNR